MVPDGRSREQPTVFGNGWLANNLSIGTGTWSFTPTAPVDTYIIWYNQTNTGNVGAFTAKYKWRHKYKLNQLERNVENCFGHYHRNS